MSIQHCQMVQRHSSEPSNLHDDQPSAVDLEQVSSAGCNTRPTHVNLSNGHHDLRQQTRIICDLSTCKLCMSLTSACRCPGTAHLLFVLLLPVPCKHGLLGRHINSLQARHHMADGPILDFLSKVYSGYHTSRCEPGLPGGTDMSQNLPTICPTPPPPQRHAL